MDVATDLTLKKGLTVSSKIIFTSPISNEHKFLGACVAEKIERLAMSFTYSLLNEQPCKWRNCNVVLNSIDHLSLHLAQHARNKPVQKSFVIIHYEY